MTTSTEHDNLEQLDNISKRLKHIIDTLGVKQSHMAEKLGLSPSGLHYILNNDVKFSKNAQKIVDYLNTTENLFAKKTTDNNTAEQETPIQRVPLYYPDQLRLHYRDTKKEKLISQEVTVTATQYAQQTLAIHMTETSFSPKFEPGDKLIFEQVQHFKDGEIILAYLQSSQHIVIKYGFYANSDIILISLDAPPIRLALDDSQVIIIGAYRECLKRAKVF